MRKCQRVKLSNGDELQKGDGVKVIGLKGESIFHTVTMTAAGVMWVDVVKGGKWRSFDVDRIVVKRKGKAETSIDLLALKEEFDG